MKCSALNKRDLPCGNEAVENGRCAFHPLRSPALVEEGPPAPAAPGVPAPAAPALDERVPALASPPPPAPPALPEADADFFSIPAAPDPATDGAPAGGALPPRGGGDEPAAGGDLPDLPPLPDLAPPPSDVVRFRWQAANVRPILAGPVQALHRRYGLRELDAGEIDGGAGVLAPVLTDLLDQVDPNSPYGAASLWLLLTYGPRFMDRAKVAPEPTPAAPLPAMATPPAPRRTLGDRIRGAG